MYKNDFYVTGSEFSGPANNFYKLYRDFYVPGNTFCKTGSDNIFTGSENFITGSETYGPNKKSHVLKTDFLTLKLLKITFLINLCKVLNFNSLFDLEILNLYKFP